MPNCSIFWHNFSYFAFPFVVISAENFLLLSQSSGSGSESGIRTQKSAKLKSGDESDNNTGSNDEEDNGSIGLIIRDGSDNGSGTQVRN